MPLQLVIIGLRPDKSGPPVHRSQPEGIEGRYAGPASKRLAATRESATLAPDVAMVEASGNRMVVPDFKRGRFPRTHAHSS